MEPESPLSLSLVPATCPCPEPARSSPYSSHHTSIHLNIILSSHLRLGLSSGLFPSVFPTKCTSARHFSLSWASSIQSIPPTSHFVKIHLNIILPSTPESPKWSLSRKFPHQNHVYVSAINKCYSTLTVVYDIWGYSLFEACPFFRL